MIKKTVILLILFILFSPFQAFAAVSREYYPPADSDFYLKKISYQLYIPHGVVKLKITQYTPLPDQEVKEVIEWDVKPNSFIWVDMWCKGNTKFEYLTETGEVDSLHVRAEGPHLTDETCPGPSVTLSDFNEEESRYAGDTFGGTVDPLENPDPNNPDGSGGTGGSGYIPPDSGENPSDGGSDGDNSGGCDCIFHTPGWEEYMNKIDEIASKIPSPPNWEQVADTFRDRIVPEIISDLEDLLGKAPSTPDPPSKPSGIDDRNIFNKVPTLQENPELDSISDQITPERIKNDAPEIPVREDESGGFDLVSDPLESLPDMPSDDFPKPGETDPGEWGQHKPEEQENPYPNPPADTRGGEVEYPPNPDNNEELPPIPGDNTGDPPIPEDDVGSPPIPGDDGGTPPIPGEEKGSWGLKYYKPSPDAPDGSGGEWNP